MPRDACAISEDISTVCNWVYAYDGIGDFLQEHKIQVRGRDKRVAIKVGRYISSDPIGLAGGLNTFNYAAVNPVMAKDTLGLVGTVTYDDGTTEAFWTAAEFQNLLASLGDLKIQNISLYGHGSCNLQAISDQYPGDITEGIQMSQKDNSVWLVGNGKAIAELKDLLKGKLIAGATINLKGCDVDSKCASANQSLTQALSSAIPNAIVSGSPILTIRWYPLFPTTSFNLYENYYLDGEKIDHYQ